MSPHDAPTVIRGGEAHVDAAWSIIDRCRTALRERGILQWDDVYPTREIVVDDVANQRLFVLIDSGKCRATVALDDRQDVQYAAGKWTAPEPALVVHRLCVDPRDQGRGYARQLMSFVEAYAARLRYSSLRLDAYSDNPSAVSLYRRRGYREAGEVLFPRRSRPFLLFERSVLSERQADFLRNHD